MIEWFRKRRALRRIARRLPRELVERYGATDAYTAEQVRTALKDGRYDRRYWGYALAMCLLADDAAAEVGGADAVQTLRGEIADRHFHGDAGFSLETARLHAAGSPAHDPGGAHGGGVHDVGGGFADGGGSGV